MAGGSSILSGLKNKDSDRCEEKGVEKGCSFGKGETYEIGGHMGTEKTEQKIKKDSFWQRMSKDIQNYIKKCHSCQSVKQPLNSKVVAKGFHSNYKLMYFGHFQDQVGEIILYIKHTSVSQCGIVMPRDTSLPPQFMVMHSRTPPLELPHWGRWDGAVVAHFLLRMA
ncbi:hypothetical protein PR048_011093 [Dryococelus australis]|uniref:Integrase zinc-binding domain-containing protein n=1 Tax=Dryococelus australis TaxID=614101 RepID=A0ABQ9HKP2_9NEOP|nr:hypothetical protein PR048_011093 [Dryococelus australis]